MNNVRIITAILERLSLKPTFLTVPSDTLSSVGDQQFFTITFKPWEQQAAEMTEWLNGLLADHNATLAHESRIESKREELNHFSQHANREPCDEPRCPVAEITIALERAVHERLRPYLSHRRDCPARYKMRTKRSVCNCRLDKVLYLLSGADHRPKEE